MMIRNVLPIIMMLGVFFWGCDGTQDPVVPDDQEVPIVEPTLADRVIDNCHAVQSAAVRFALENENEFPHDINDVSAGGHTLLELLPDSICLENPATGECTEPVDYTAWRSGQTAYRPLYIYDESLGRRFALGYVITGFAESARCITLSNLSPSYYEKEERTIENCFAVMRAAEAFASENGGLYPQTTSAEKTPLGHTLIDLLPEGMRLENPYHLCRTEPIDGAAAVHGETGYMVCVNGEHQPAGYVITGVGDTYDFIIQICHTCE